MSGHPADFRVEIIQCRPQGIVSPTLGSPPSAAPIDITSRVLRDGFGTINRAMDRDLLSFKTGDLTLSMLNRDGYFDDLFAFFGATTIWSLRVYRRGEVQFWGALIGLGSITFDRKARTCEMTAYGLSKLLDMTSAEPVSRTIAAMTVTTAVPATPQTLTLNSTSGILSGDVLHLTDHVNKEDATVKQVTSATVVQLEATLGNTYASGSEVTCTTQFYRYKSIAFLVEELFTEAGIGISQLEISNSQFNTLAPTPVNASGLATFATTNPVYTCPSERNDRVYQTHLVNGTYYQASPDESWVNEDATVRAWVDWSPYFLEADSGPSFLPRTPETGEATGELDPHATGWDLRGATQSMYMINRGTGRLQVRTSTDGLIWVAAADVPTPDIPGWSTNQTGEDCGCEYDPVRNLVLVWSTNSLADTLTVYDVATPGWTSVYPGSGQFGGFTYCRDLDMWIGLKTSTGASVGPSFTIVAIRGTAILWERAFPNVLVATLASTLRLIYPTHSLRYINGKLYCVVISDGKTQLVVSDDEFQTYTMRALTDPGTGTRAFGGRVKGAYVIACYRDTLQRGLFYAAPFYAGVVEYADFEGNSIAEALNKLSVLANALYWVDDDLQGHFVARDLYDSGAILDIESRIKESQDVILWDQTAQYVTVSGNSVEATAGDAGFSSEGIELASDFLPNEAFAQALADSYFDFYSAARQYHEKTLHDRDGTIFHPLDRVTPDGASRFLVYESDHSLIDDEIRVSLLEDK